MRAVLAFLVAALAAVATASEIYPRNAALANLVSYTNITAWDFYESVWHNKLTVVDVRDPLEEFAVSHIPASFNVPLGNLSAHFAEIPTLEPVYVHCKGGFRSVKAAEQLVAAGFSNIVNIMDGFDAWKGPTKTEVRPFYRNATVDEVVEKLAKYPDLIQIVDVRTAEQYNTKHIKGAVNLPMDALVASQGAGVDRIKTVYFYCNSGFTSQKTADAVSEFGFFRIANMLGGINQWTGPTEPAAGKGCF